MNLLEQQKLGEWLWTLTDWILAHRGKSCLPLATRDTLFRYVAHAWLNGRLAVARDDKGGIEAVGFNWIDFREHIEMKAAEGRQQYFWEENHSGDAWFVAEVIGSRHGVSKLYQASIAKWPHLLNVPMMTYRKGKLVEIPKARLQQFTSHL